MKKNEPCVKKKATTGKPQKTTSDSKNEELLKEIQSLKSQYKQETQKLTSALQEALDSKEQQNIKSEEAQTQHSFQMSNLQEENRRLAAELKESLKQIEELESRIEVNKEQVAQRKVQSIDPMVNVKFANCRCCPA